MDLDTILRGALPPILAALLLVSLAGARLLPLAVGVGLYVAFGLLKQSWPPLPTELWSEPNGMGWLLWGMLALSSVGLLERLRLLPARVSARGGPALAAVAAWLVLQKVASHCTGVEIAMLVGSAALLAIASVLAMRTVLGRASGSVASAAVFAVVLSLDAVIVTMGKSAFLGQLCGAVAAAVGASAVTCAWRRGLTLTAADAVWLGGAHALFLLAGAHLAYLSWEAAGCAMGAPFLLLLLPASFAQERPKSWVTAAAALVAVPMAVALWLSWPEPNPYGY